MEGSGAPHVGAHDTPLIDAARHGRAADVAALLAGGADVNEPKTDGSGVTALHIACYFGRAEIVTKLLAANANVNQPNNKGDTPPAAAGVAPPAPRGRHREKTLGPGVRAEGRVGRRTEVTDKEGM